MAVVQISRIQHRRGLATDLPQLAAGELGWVVDQQKLYIGNGKVSDGAPAVGNTEILTAGSSSVSTAISYYYKGYLGASTPIVPGASGNFTRTLQTKIDDYVSVKDFGALGDGSTNDVAAIQRALDELYCDTDRDDERARRVLYFPAGDYRINASLKVPPFATLKGEGMNKTVIMNSGSVPVITFQDDEKNIDSDIGSSSATKPQNITFQDLTIYNSAAYAGVEIEQATNVVFQRVELRGSYAANGSDNSASKGVTTISTAVTACSKIYFDNCKINKFARLVDMSQDVTNVRFTNCDFDTGYYGALIGAEMDGSTAGLSNGPRDVQFISSSWSNIGQQAILVAPTAGADAGTGPRNIISSANYYAQTVGNNFEGVGSIREVPIIQYNNDECVSNLDFFERTDLRRTDGSSELNMAPEVQGIGRLTNSVKQVTLADNTSAATTTTLEYPIGSGTLGKSIKINYKMERGALTRVGTFSISVNASTVAFHDDFVENSTTVGVTLTAAIDREDSTSTDKTVIVKFTSTSTGTAITMDAEATQLV